MDLVIIDVQYDFIDVGKSNLKESTESYNRMVEFLNKYKHFIEPTFPLHCIKPSLIESE